MTVSASHAMDCLPDELLYWVLSFVPSEELLPLRLVSRRWSHAVLQRPVWQHRSLHAGLNEMCGFGFQNTGWLRTVARLVPALRSLYLRLTAGSTAGVAAAEALGRGSCQVLKLTLIVTLQTKRGTHMSKRCIAAIRRMLEGQRLCLKEIRLTISCSKSEHHPFDHGILSLKETVHHIFSWIEIIPLDKFAIKLNCGLCDPPGHASCLTADFLSYEFTGLRALRRLSWCSGPACGPSASTLRSLVAGAKETLQVLSADMDITPLVDALPDCGLLQQLNIPTMAEWGFLRHCASLDVLTVYANRSNADGEMALDRVRSLLTKAHLPREVRVVVRGYSVATLATQSACLSRARHLELRSIHVAAVDHADWLLLLRRLPALEHLMLRGSGYMNTTAAGTSAWLSGWTADAVPSLARLTVMCSRAAETHTQAALDQLKHARPRLIVERTVLRY